MKLRTKYILFVGGLHTLFLVLCYLVFKDNKLYFILSESVVLISILISIRLYYQMVAPLNQLSQGINAIRDRDFNVKFRPTGTPEMDALTEVYNEMMDALKEERTRQEAQHFFLEKLIHTSPTGIVILDYDRQIKQINPKASQILGADPEVFIAELSHMIPGDVKTRRIGGHHTFKVQLSHFIDRGFPRVFVMIEEVTEQIMEAEKNAYGKVIRMMAHEVNNTVGPVNSIINLTLQTSGLWELQDRSSLKNALQVAVDRNQNLNLFMRNFANLVKLAPVNKAPFDLVPVIDAVIRLFEPTAFQLDISFNLNLGTSAFPVFADALQIEQVLINVVKNAIEAIRGKGQIVIDLNRNDHSLIVSDNGPGIPDALAEHLFSPFFSTKKDGQGIGLTLVREILLNHGFDFSLRTVRPGRTEFQIGFKPALRSS